MPSLYRNIDQLKPSYARQDFSLVDRLTSERNAYIEGVRFVEIGSEEWERVVSNVRTTQRRLGASEDRIERAVERLSDYADAQTSKFPEPTSLRGLKLRSTSPFENFISDWGLNIICYIRPNDKVVDAVPYYEPDGRQLQSFYYDAGKVATPDTFKYDGSLRDALIEFQQKGFSFNLGRWPIPFSIGGQKSDRSNPDTLWSPRMDYVIVRTNVTIDDIFSSR